MDSCVTHDKFREDCRACQAAVIRDGVKGYIMLPKGAGYAVGPFKTKEAADASGTPTGTYTIMPLVKPD